MENSASGLTSSKEPIGSSPLAYAKYLHDSGNEYVTVARKTDHEPWIQTSYRVEKLYEVLPDYAGLNDVYLSLNRFYGSRKRLAELSAMYSDLDYYKVPELARMPPEGVYPSTGIPRAGKDSPPLPSYVHRQGSGPRLATRTRVRFHSG